MSETVIKVENLSKKYILAHQQTKRYVNLREVMTRGVKNLSKKLIAPFSSSTTPHLHHSTEEFYALKDINFEIKQGQQGRHHRTQWCGQVNTPEDFNQDN